MTGRFAGKIYDHLEADKFLPEEQKGCRRNSRGTKDKLLIDKMVIKNCKRRMTYLCLTGKNTIESINSWAVVTVRYNAGIVNWTKEDLREMDRKTRKLLTIHRCMQPQADVDRLYWKRKEGGQDLISIEDCITMDDYSLGNYINTKQEELLKEVSKENILKER